MEGGGSQTIIALAVTLVGILLVNPHSMLNFFYYLSIFSLFIAIFHRAEIRAFVLAFCVNSALISIVYIIQTSVYPDSFGTSSPLGSWTDDSFFFALVADTTPPSLVLRDNYFLYTAVFSDIVRAITLFPIHHPMDVIFFQSGTAGILTTFLRLFVIKQTGDVRMANVAFVLALFCPFLLMNGGAFFLRDTLAAALFIYSLCCFNSRQWPLALAAFIIQVLIRPGTGLILLPIYYIVFIPNLREMGSRAGALIVGLPVVTVVGLILAVSFLDISHYQQYLDTMSITGRDYLGGLQTEGQSNQILIAIQQQPFVIRFILNGAYIFLYPFLSWNAFDTPLFDLRSIMLNLAIPLESFWLNAWFVAGAITRNRVSGQQRQISFAVIAAMLIIGTYSMQTRHKTIIYPLYYFVVALGFTRSEASERRIGYLVSGLFLAFQILALLR